MQLVVKQSRENKNKCLCPGGGESAGPLRPPLSRLLELDVLFRSDFCEEAGRSGGSGGETSLGNPAPVGRAEVTLSPTL